MAQERADRVGSRRGTLQGDLPCVAVLRAPQRPAWSQKSRRGGRALDPLVICYHLLEREVPYEELGEDYFDRQRSGEACVKRLVCQLERLGHKVALEPLP